MYIVEKAGEGTVCIIIEAPQEDKIQVKAVHTSNRDMEMEDVPLR
ncbi:MAG: hypothetical protein ACRD38_00120 [Nitrososphaerales archaeon]